MTKKISIVVVIPTHNRLTLFQRTLDSVLACEPPIGKNVRLIVVENGGQFGVEKQIKKNKSWLTPEYLYVKDGNKSAALNAVVDSLDNELIVFLDDDVRVEPHLLQQYAEAADDNPNGCFFGGPFAVDYVEKPPNWLLGYLPTSAKGWEPVQYEPIAPGALWFIGFNWAAYAVDIKRASGFNPEVGPGAKSGATGQETTMQQALVKNGIAPVYLPNARVWHYVPASRCSPDWALERAFKSGVTIGMTMDRDAPNGVLFGLPRWMLRKRLELSWKLLKARFIASRQEAFRVRYNLARFRGKMRGARKLFKNRH